MIRQKDRLVERYLDGRMTPAEERRFRDRLEEDEQLVGMLRAELLIRSTMAGERGRMRADHSRSRTRAMALLAAMPRGAEAAAAGTGTGGALSGLAGIKGIVALLAAAAVTVGSYVALLPAKAPNPNAPSAPATNIERTPDHVQMPPQPVPVTPEPPAAIPTAKRELPGSDAGVRSAAPRPQPEQKEAAEAQETHAAAAVQKAEPEGTITPEQPAPTMQNREKPPVTIRNDTLRTRLKIEPMQRP